MAGMRTRSSLFEFLAAAVLVVATVAALIRIEFVQQFLFGQVQLWDFDVYYRLAHDSLGGQNPYQVSYMQTAGPPLVIMPFVLFVSFPLAVARGLIAAVSLLAVWGTAYVVAKAVYPQRLFLVALALQLILLLSFPVRFNFITGQPNLLIMFFAAVALTTRSENARGVVVGLMSLIKTNYVLLLVAMLKHHIRAVVIAVGVLGIGFLASLLVLKPTIYLDYFNQRAPGYLFSVPAINDVDYVNQSLRSTTARLGIEQWYVALFLCLLVLAVSYLLVSGDIIGGLLFSLLASPLIWQHYIVVAYPALILMGFVCWGRKWLFGLWSVAAVLLLTHFPGLDNHSLDFWHGLQASHYFFGLVLLLGIQMWLQYKNRQPLT